jgi:hypothetical protein
VLSRAPDHTQLRSLYRQIRASDLLRLIYGDTCVHGSSVCVCVCVCTLCYVDRTSKAYLTVRSSCGAMIRLGASKSGQLGVVTSERAKMSARYCVLNDVFLLAYDKPSDGFPKVWRVPVRLR